MGKSIPVTIGTTKFSKKVDALTYLKEILNRYGLGGTVQDDDHAFLLAALQKHPEATVKIGTGVSHFVVQKSPDHKTRCFWVHRTDGSMLDFSYKSCVN